MEEQEEEKKSSILIINFKFLFLKNFLICFSGEVKIYAFYLFVNPISGSKIGG